MLLLIIAALCLLYYVIIVCYSGFGTSFSWIWLAVGILCGLIQVLDGLFRKGLISHAQSLPVRVSFWTTVGVVGVLAVIIEAMVVVGMFAQTKPSDLDYLIVLGTKVNGDEPSKSLRYRLDKAIEYLEKDDELIVVVTGGQSPGADVTEAYAMASYLIDAGVSPKRIMVEGEAMSTRENLIFSYGMIGDDDAKVGIVTNSFHVYRATSLAEKLGYDNAVGIAAPSDKVLLLNNMMREFFVIIKEKIMGYI